MSNCQQFETGIFLHHVECNQLGKVFVDALYTHELSNELDLGKKCNEFMSVMSPQAIVLSGRFA